MRLRLAELPIYVAHYSKLVERRARLQKDLSELGLRATWLTEHDSEDISDDVLQRCYPYNDDVWRLKTEFYTSEPPRPIKRSEASLAFKHLEFYRRLRDAAHACALVLEDDVLFDRHFCDHFDRYFTSVPDDFDFIFIGSGCNLRVPNPSSTVHFYPKSTPSTKCTDSYLITRRAAERLLAVMPPLTLPIDFELNYQLHALQMRVYWLEPPLVVQGSQSGLYRSAIQ